MKYFGNVNGRRGDRLGESGRYEYKQRGRADYPPSTRCLKQLALPVPRRSRSNACADLVPFLALTN